MKLSNRLTITEVAGHLGVTPRTIMRWEKAGKIKRSKRDWRGWRFFYKEDLDKIKEFYESIYDFNELEKSAVATVKDALIVLLVATGVLSLSLLAVPCYADSTGIRETKGSVDIVLDELPARGIANAPITEGVKYTLGPDDVINIDVRKHPEFSGEYKINKEGKIEYKYVGDIVVNGLTKKEVKEQLTEILSEYLILPNVDVQIMAYLSKVYYVVGEVGKPGKYYMMGDEVLIREALVQSGLPTHAAAMRRCRLITPNDSGKDNFVKVNVYELLYGGDLGENIAMKPGDILYIPATLMAKAIRIIQPVTNVVAETAGKAVAGASMAAVAL